MFTRRSLLVLAPLLVFVLTVPAGARGYRSQSPHLLHYHATGEYDVYVSGRPVESDVFFSRGAATYIVALKAQDHAFVLRQRSRTVGRVSAQVLKRRADGFVELPSNAPVQSLGRFWLSGSDVVVKVTGLDARLKPRAPLLKSHTGRQILEHSPQYAIHMRAYRPQAGAIAQLKASTAKNVEVEVLFGSWCSRCQRLLGRMLRVEEAVGKSNIRFRYYGLPRPPAAWREAHYRASGIHGLPTAVVKVNGTVRGRIASNSWGRLESALAQYVR